MDYPAPSSQLPNEAAPVAYMKTAGGARPSTGRPQPQRRGVGDRTSMIAAGAMPAGAGAAGEPIDDRELLVRVQGGDAGAFDTLVQR
jgi:hypothetical protein